MKKIFTKIILLISVASTSFGTTIHFTLSDVVPIHNPNNVQIAFQISGPSGDFHMPVGVTGTVGSVFVADALTPGFADFHTVFLAPDPEDLLSIYSIDDVGVEYSVGFKFFRFYDFSAEIDIASIAFELLDVGGGFTIEGTSTAIILPPGVPDNATPLLLLTMSTPILIGLKRITAR